MSKPHYPTRRDARLTSKFGERVHPITRKHTFHFGLDFAPRVAGTRGVPIYAVRDGVVTERFYSHSGGNTLRIKHQHEDISTGYLHLDLVRNNGMMVKVGDRVKEGQQIGVMGTTGNSTGVHLHFEVVKGGRFNHVRSNYLDPEIYLNTAVDQLVVDGLWGKKTTERLQDLERLRFVDGVISHQWKTKSNENILSAQFDRTQKGSLTIRHIQRQLKLKEDGLCGQDTIRAMQRHKGTPVDGVISKGSLLVRAIQRDLNNGRSPFGR